MAVEKEPQLAAKVATRVGAGDGVREGTFGCNRLASTCGRHSTGEGPRANDHLIFWR